MLFNIVTLWNPWTLSIIFGICLVFLGRSYVLKSRELNKKEFALDLCKDMIKDEKKLAEKRLLILKQNKEKLSEFAMSLFVNPEGAEGLAKAIAPYAGELHDDTYTHFVDILLRKTREELETSLDDESFTEIFIKASKLIDFIKNEDSHNFAAINLLKRLNREVFADEEVRSKIKRCIANVFKSKKTNPLLSYINYQEMVMMIQQKDEASYDRFKQIIDVLVSYASNMMYEIISDQISYYHHNKKSLIKVEGYDFEYLYNEILPILLNSSDKEISPFHKGLLLEMRDSEFKKHSRILKR